MDKITEVVPHTDGKALQQFLSHSPWDYQGVMEQVAEDANLILGGKDSALLLDETSIVKKGQHSVGVGRQWCEPLGKVENCQVGVFAALAKGCDVCLIDAELYLPKSWREDHDRCDRARIPENKRAPRSKLDIAITLVERAKENGLDYGWIGAPSLYGRDRALQKALDALGECFVLDVPSDFLIYLDDPKPYLHPSPKLGREPARYKSNSQSTKARDLVNQLDLKTFQSNKFRIDTKGQMQFEALHQHIWVWDGQSKQAHYWHLIASREAGGEMKYSISNAPPQTSTHRLLYMQGQCHSIERSFQDSKSHLGLDQYQARNWNAWHHHMSLIMMAMVFLLQQSVTKKKEQPLLTVSDMVYIFVSVLVPWKNVLTEIS